ncbi:MAG: hypothetical protein GTO41_12055, partial [Burkholderiales bacterium]|nr:hypothetical protein [Burkholderiales bacterium]
GVNVGFNFKIDELVDELHQELTRAHHEARMAERSPEAIRAHTLPLQLPPGGIAGITDARMKRI